MASILSRPQCVKCDQIGDDVPHVSVWRTHIFFVEARYDSVEQIMILSGFRNHRMPVYGTSRDNINTLAFESET